MELKSASKLLKRSATFLIFFGRTITFRKLHSDFYSDVSKDELFSELKHLKAFHSPHLGDKNLKPFKLLNKITNLKLESTFSNIPIALHIFLTLLVTVAVAEHSFSKLKLIKNYHRSNMGQDRLVDLAILGIESDLAIRQCSKTLVNFGTFNKKPEK